MKVNIHVIIYTHDKYYVHVRVRVHLKRIFEVSYWSAKFANKITHNAFTPDTSRPFADW